MWHIVAAPVFTTTYKMTGKKMRLGSRIEEKDIKL